MTYHNDSTLPEALLESIADNGLDCLPDLFRILVNAAMQLERQKYLNAQPHERTPERAAHANGFKDKSVSTRMGAITFAVPQVREGGFYPSSLERGSRSERALKLALAEMYVQGVSTRKVAAITEQLGGFEVEGRRHILGVSVARSEAEVHWRAFLSGLVRRGLRGVRLITSDDHAGL